MIATLLALFFGEFRGWFGDGAVAHLRVVAIYTRGLGFASMTVPHDTLLPHTASGLDDTVFVASDGHAEAAVRASLARLAPTYRLSVTIEIDDDGLPGRGMARQLAGRRHSRGQPGHPHQLPNRR